MGSRESRPVSLLALDGHYNGNGARDGADYVLSPHAMQTPTAIPQDTTPEYDFGR